MATQHKASGARRRSRAASLGEFGIIERIAAQLGRAPARWPVGIGDDAAVARATASPREAPELLAALDVLVDGVHFRREWSRPEEIARKALAVNASDIAAMGGTPFGALLGLALPGNVDAAWIRAFARGLRAASRDLGMPVVGGDTVRSDRITLAVAVLGDAARGRGRGRQTMRRSGVRAGDLLCVTGHLGAAAAGLALLEGQSHASARQQRDALVRAAGSGTRADIAALRDALARHLTGCARLAEGAALARLGARAAIDISDGLASDALHLARASGVTVTLDAASIPLHPAAHIMAARTRGRARRSPLDYALSGGDDYELLVAIPPRLWLRARRACARMGLTVIGRATSGPACVMLRRGDGRLVRLTPSGYDHFRET